MDVSSETSTKLSVKKRFLKTYLEGSDVEKIDTTSNSTDTNEAPPSQPHLSLASQEQTVPLSSVVGTVPTQECPPVSSSVLPNSVEHFASLPRAYPAIEYEVSDYECKMLEMYGMWCFDVKNSIGDLNRLLISQ